MAGAMLTNSRFARQVQEEIHGRERESPSPTSTVYYRGQYQYVLYLVSLMQTVRYLLDTLLTGFIFVFVFYLLECFQTDRTLTHPVTGYSQASS